MCAVPNMAVFCSSLTSYFHGMLLTHFLNDFEMTGAGGVGTWYLQKRDIGIYTHQSARRVVWH